MLGQNAMRIPPGVDAMKLNVVACLSWHGDKGVAMAVCRDGNSTFLGALAIIFDGLIDPPNLEAHAFNEALELSQDPHISKMIVASVYLEVVTNINNGSSSSYAAILREINHCWTSFESVSSWHEYREANLEARALAKATPSLDIGRHVWLGNPPLIACTLLKLNYE